VWADIVQYKMVPGSICYRPLNVPRRLQLLAHNKEMVAGERFEPLAASLFRASYRVGQVAWTQRMLLNVMSLWRRLFRMARDRLG
jgi:hypothetical protein